jgi:hypothetical protein
MAIAEVVEAQRTTNRISWAGVFAGTLIALGVWMLLHTLGLAAGLTALDPDNPRTLRGVGIGTGIWSIIAPLIALFVGGVVSSRGAGYVDRAVGAIQGAVVWALTTVVGAILVAMAIVSMVGLGVRAGAAAVSGAAGAAGAAGSAIGLDMDDAITPINQHLEQQGLPPVSADQINAATRDALATAARTGKLDRQAIVTALSRNTSLSREDAETLAGSIEQQWNAKRAEIGPKVQHGALQAAETAGKALWGVFIAMVLGLASAAIGGVLGVSQRQRFVAEVAPTPVVTPPVRPAPVRP